MPVSSKTTRNRSQLRAEAAFRLKIGIASGTEWSLGADTLALLFRLASSPDTVMDGLKLLHELQTHQVELEMQHQELERGVQLYNKQLGHFKTLFDHAPFGYLVVQADGVITDSNQAAARLLGLTRKACNGQIFESFCTSLSAYGLQDLLKHLSLHGPPQVCVLELKPAEGRPKRIQLLITRSPDTGAFFFGLSSYDELLKI
jgi:PAS domain S-box-containing protein